MPIHDWSRASEAAFHDFQLGWACRLASELNGGILPESMFALNETVELRPAAAFHVMPEPDDAVLKLSREEQLLDAAINPPPGSIRVSDERRQYACPVVTVRNRFHQPEAAILWVTGQDKATPYRLDAVVALAVGAITHGIHLLIVDLFPPSKRDPQGIHKLIWDGIEEESFSLPPDKRLTVAAYSAGDAIAAYVEPLAVGDPLPNMPLFLAAEQYVSCPLESSYKYCWDGFPELLKSDLEATPDDLDTD